MANAAAPALGPAASFADSEPRLPRITRSWNPLVWIAMAAYRSLGVTTPVEVMFARAPRLIVAHMILMVTSEYATSLDRRSRSLARVFGSRVNGCMFCDDIETKMALASGTISREDADALPGYASSSRFSDREKAMLAYVEEINTTRTASDDTFAALRHHLGEREVVELTWINAVGNYLNLQARPLRLAPEGACAIPPRGEREV